MGVGVNEIDVLFNPITNVLAMGVITQGHVAHFVVRKTI
jgi:hypothetical protein